MPVRMRMLTALLERMLAAPPSPVSSALVPRLEISRPAETSSSDSHSAAQTLTVLRDFSSILTHSLDAEAMLRQFLLFLRKIVSINRAAIFLRQPYAAFDGVAAPEESRRCARRAYRLVRRTAGTFRTVF